MKRLGKESGFDISTPQHKCARLFGQRALMPLPVPASLLCIAANAQWYVLLLMHSGMYCSCGLSGWQRDLPLLHVLAGYYSLRIRSDHLQKGISLTFCPRICDYRPVLVFPLLIWSFTHQVCPSPEAISFLAWDQAFLCMSSM